MEENISRRVIELRRDLHRKLVKRMKELDICANEKNTENFKRWYLWDFHNVETSRALNETQLNNAIKSLQLIDKNSAVGTILTKYTGYESERDLLKCSDGQIRNITAIAKYRLKLKEDAIKQWTTKSLKRKVWLWELTVEEAHHCIKRLEEWEAKALRSKAS